MSTQAAFDAYLAAIEQAHAVYVAALKEARDKLEAAGSKPGFHPQP